MTRVRRDPERLQEIAALRKAQLRKLDHAHFEGICVECGEDAGKFTNIGSLKQYDVSGTCQTCQDTTEMPTSDRSPRKGPLISNLRREQRNDLRDIRLFRFRRAEPTYSLEC